MQNMPQYIRDLVLKYGIRNVTILTAGADRQRGHHVRNIHRIEPFFSWTYFRRSRIGVHQEKNEDCPGLA